MNDGGNEQNVFDFIEVIWKYFLENYFVIFKKLISKTIFKNSFYYLCLVIFMIFSNIFYIFHKITENN